MHNETSSEWLVEAVTTGSFAWDKAVTTTFPHLLNHITLHDSILSYASITEGNSVLLVIALDAFWNKVFCHQLEDWPYLVIEISKPLGNFYDLTAEAVMDTIMEAESKPVAYSKIAAWFAVGKELGILPADYYARLKEAHIHRTELSTLKGDFTCLHLEDIRILLYSEDGNLLPIDLTGEGRYNADEEPILKQKEPGVFSRLFHWLTRK